MFFELTDCQPCDDSKVKTNEDDCESHDPKVRNFKLFDCRVALRRLPSETFDHCDSFVPHRQDDIVHEHVDDSMDSSLYSPGKLEGIECDTKAATSDESSLERHGDSESVTENSQPVGEIPLPIGEIPLPKDIYSYRTAPPSSVDSSARDFPSSCFSSTTQDTSPATFSQDTSSPLINSRTSPSSVVSAPSQHAGVSSPTQSVASRQAAAADIGSSSASRDSIPDSRDFSTGDSNPHPPVSNAEADQDMLALQKKRKLNISAALLDSYPKKTRLDLSVCSIEGLIETEMALSSMESNAAITMVKERQQHLQEPVTVLSSQCQQESSTVALEQAAALSRDPRTLLHKSGVRQDLGGASCVNGSVTGRRGSSSGYNGVNNNNHGA